MAGDHHLADAPVAERQDVVREALLVALDLAALGALAPARTQSLTWPGRNRATANSVATKKPLAATSTSASAMLRRSIARSR